MTDADWLELKESLMRGQALKNRDPLGDSWASSKTSAATSPADIRAARNGRGFSPWTLADALALSSAHMRQIHCGSVIVGDAAPEMRVSGRSRL